MYKKANKFQSTHSRRVRRNSGKTVQQHRDFNPRTQEECDFLKVNIRIEGDRFQSTHSRRVRQVIINERELVLHISIHALKKSAT